MVNWFGIADVADLIVSKRGGRNHGGVSRQELIDSYATIRAFLRKQGL